HIFTFLNPSRLCVRVCLFVCLCVRECLCVSPVYLCPFAVTATPFPPEIQPPLPAPALAVPESAREPPAASPALSCSSPPLPHTDTHTYTHTRTHTHTSAPPSPLWWG